MRTRKRLFQPEPDKSAGLDVTALAPMVDMMTLLLVFLLRSYSNEAAPAPPTGTFTLAGTLSETSRQGGNQLLISKEGIYLDNLQVLSIAALSQPQDSAMIRPLYDPLLLIRNKERLEVIADRDVPYAVLRQVFQTARLAGFQKITLVGANRGSL